MYEGLQFSSSVPDTFDVSKVPFVCERKRSAMFQSYRLAKIGLTLEVHGPLSEGHSSQPTADQLPPWK